MRKIVSVSAILLAFAAPFASADQGDFLLGGEGGIAVPTGDFGDAADSGPAAGVFGDYMVTPNLAIGVDALFLSVGASGDLLSTLSSSIEDVTFQLLQFTGHGRWVLMPDEQAMPYVTAGGGVYNVRTDFVGTGASDENETKAGIFGGAGLDFRVGSMFRVGAEATYHTVFTDPSNRQVVTVVGRLSFSFAGQTE